MQTENGLRPEIDYEVRVDVNQPLTDEKLKLLGDSKKNPTYLDNNNNDISLDMISNDQGIRK